MSITLCLLSAAAFAPQNLPFAGGDRAFPRIGQPIAAQVGDVDGDTDVDALIATSQGVYLTRQLEPGSFEQPGRLLENTAFPNLLGRLVLFDADGDSDLDLLLGRFNVQTRLLLNNGSGAYLDGDELLPSQLFPNFNPLVANAGDLDGDGDQDLLFVSHGISRKWINAGASGFVDRVLGPLYATEQELADVDGDGDLDRISATPGYCPSPVVCGAGAISIALNDGSGIFTSKSFPDTELYTRQLALGDVDQDGDLDLVAASDELGLPSRLFRNAGDGSFTLDASALPAVPGKSTGAVLLDLENDGDLDLYLSGNTGIGSHPDMDEVLLLNEPAGFVEAGDRLPADPCCEPGRAIAADLDGDLDDDLLLVADFPRLLLQQSDASFADATPLRAVEKGGLSAAPQAALVLGDLDGDGAADGARARGSALELLSNDGRGELAPQLLTNVVPSAPEWNLALADVDGDGDRDLYAAATGDLQMLWRNDGNGGLTQIAGALPPYVLSYDSDFFDADNDGDLDLATTDTTNVLLLNDGSGQFSEDSSFAAGNPSKLAAAGDFDDDGDVDLIAYTAPSTNTLYRNEPGAQWALSNGNDLFFNSNARDLDVGDLDGDGKLDLLVSGATALYVARGDGSGSFAPSFDFGSYESERSSLADLDGDGDLDAVARELWRNEGQGTYKLATPLGFELIEMVGTLAEWPLAVGDLDADGDLDVLFDRLIQYENLTRATTWHSLAGLGRTLALRMHGPSLTPWVLGWSLGSASVALPPFGTLQLDPSTLQLLAAGLLSIDGQAARTVPVPQAPSVLGVQVHWQSLVGAPLRFTDRTTTTVLGL